MTPRALRQALATHGPSWPNDPLELLAAVETAADEAPGEPAWTTLLLAAHLYATAPTGLPEGLRRGELVRFDGLSATWSARDAEGAAFLVRVPRPTTSPVERRLIERDARALQGLVEDIRVVDGSVLAPLVGAAVVGPLPASEAVRLVGTTLVALERWRTRGFGPLTPAEGELRHVGGKARLVCLTPGPLMLEGWLRHLTFTLRMGGPLGPVLRGLVELPPTTPAEAGDRLRRAFVQDLSARALQLRQAQLLAGHSRRRQRLVHVLTRMQRVLPPPAGESAIGFDLEARPTSVSSDGSVVTWGAESEPQRLYADGAFDAPAARRLLRALATSPKGSSGYPEQIGRWVSAGLRLRTLRLLLEKSR